MIRHAWYAAARTSEITQQPMRREVNGEDLVLYRGADGTVHTFAAWCPHRGCDLSLGKVCGDGLECAYHGWQFDKDGACVRIPANKRRLPIPKRFGVRVYPAKEMAGLVFVCLDSCDPAPAFPQWPELTEPSWHGVPFDARWDAHFTRVVESVMDVSHLPFVHPETTGRDCDPAVTGPDLSVFEGRILVYPTPFAPAHPLEPVPVPETVDDRTEIELHFPNHWIIRTPMGDDKFFATYLTFTPTAGGQTQIYGLALRNFQIDSAWFDSFHLEHTLFVMGQDQAVVERLHPKVTPFDLRVECHVPSDAPTIHFRKMLSEALQVEG